MTLPAVAPPLITAFGGLFLGFFAAWFREEYIPYYYKARRKNLEALREKVGKVKRMLDEWRERTNGTAVLINDVCTWMRMAELFLNEVVLDDKQRNIESRCLNGFLPNCCHRFVIGMSIEKYNEVFDKIMEEGNHLCSKPVVKGYQQPRNETVIRTREKDIREIWECLRDRGDVNTICIHGIAGVGKTAVAEAIYNQALQDQNETFHYVIWVSAEFGIQLENLQEKMANSLNISFPDTNDSTVNTNRTVKLREELVQRKKCLVILDFLWEDLSLEEIGIPQADSSQGVVCKVIITTRSPLMCPRMKTDECFEIKPLSKRDTWEFFTRTINVSSLEGETRMLEKAVEDCGGLPYAILMLAMRMRESRQRLGEIGPNNLSSQGRLSSSADMQFQRLVHSYDRLDSRSQQCFLYCSLYPKGYPIEVKQLIKFWIWEGLLDHYINSLDEMRRMGMLVLGRLKDARLLEIDDTNSSNESVKMLGLFHDMAVYIIRRQELGFFTRAGNNLNHFPPLDDQSGVIKRASFVHNQLHALTREPNCPNLSTLILQNNPLDWFSETFFSGIPNLKLLDLSYTQISLLPQSALRLNHLRALFLRHCSNLKHLPSLSTLEQLLVLDLFGTPLEDLPADINKLKKLRRLDLSHTKLTSFRAGLVSSLESLQEFLMIMDNAEGYSWRSKNTSSRSREAFVEELAHLEGLMILETNFFSTKVLNTYLLESTSRSTRQHPGVTPSFRFCAGGFHTSGNLGENSIALINDYRIEELPQSTLELYLAKHNQILNTLQQTNINFGNLKVLDVSEYKGLTYLFSVEVLDNLYSLEKISVRECWSFLGLIKPVDTLFPCFFPRLQELQLIDLPKLNSICSDQVLNCPAFCRLSVWNCENLTKLPRFESRVEDRMVPRKIKVTGKISPSLKSWMLLDSQSHLTFKETDVPEDTVSFISVKTPDLTPQINPNDGQANFFKRKKAERTRFASISGESSGGGSPQRQSPGYVARRLGAAAEFMKRVPSVLFSGTPQM